MGKSDYEIEMNDGMGEVILDHCTIHFDPDNSAEHYLKRGISRQAFFEFAGHIGEIMIQSMENKITVDLDLKHIRMENDVPHFSVCIGESGLTDEKAAIYLKELAYKTNFAGSDFLMYLYEYLTFIDTNKGKPLSVIVEKIYALASGVTGTFQKNTMAGVPTENVTVKAPFSARMNTPVDASVSSQMNMSITAPVSEPVNIPEKIPNAEQTVQYSENGETGVLDPSFWTRYGGMTDSNHEENPYRVKRNEASAVLQSLKDGQRYSLNKDCIVFGKDAASADYVLNNETISRAHAEVTRRNDGYYITDLGSTNGTFINTKKLPKNTPIAVSNGDTVKFSNEELRFMTI